MSRFPALAAIRAKPAPDLALPEAFVRLQDVAFNLWWSWNPLADAVFSRIDRARWERYRNPVEMLLDLEPTRWNTLQEDDHFARLYHELVHRFDAYVDPAEPTWFESRHPGRADRPFAYFSTEYGWHECLQIYSGGLGVLSGDHCKAASDLGLPFVGVGLMYRHGYFWQTIDADGRQQHFYPDYDFARLPLLPVVDERGREVHVPVELAGRRVFCRVWRAMVGRVPVLLLDSDLPINHPADRPITSVLYVRGREMRLCQEILLGVGGVRTLRALGISPSVWHLNEGHSALLVVERLRELAEQEPELGLDEAVERVAASTIFTTHTPVPAGNEVFDTALVRRLLSASGAGNDERVERILPLGRARPDGGDDGSFNLTALALRASARSNGVSRMHGETANRLWGALLERIGRPPIEYVTNGVHPASWLGRDMDDLLRSRLGPGYLDRLLEDGFADGVDAIPDYQLWTTHIAQKRRLIVRVRQRLLEQYARHGRSPDELRHVDELFDPHVLTLGFARRFATYKRAALLLRDAERFRALLTDADRPVQLLFAGKAHPADRPGQDLIAHISQVANDPATRGRIAFIENYDMRLARDLVQGVDVWLNTPRRPEEASGTSGMKAAMNGVLNVSILDGWWAEGHDPDHGWALGGEEHGGDAERQDAADAESLYRVLVDQVIPTYYERNEQGLPVAWLRRMKRAIGELTPRFSAGRMVSEYVERYDPPASRSELDPRGAGTPSPGSPAG